jgi:hypothetical protein
VQGKRFRMGCLVDHVSAPSMMVAATTQPRRMGEARRLGEARRPPT